MLMPSPREAACRCQSVRETRIAMFPSLEHRTARRDASFAREVREGRRPAGSRLASSGVQSRRHLERRKTLVICAERAAEDRSLIPIADLAGRRTTLMIDNRVNMPHFIS